MTTPFRDETETLRADNQRLRQRLAVYEAPRYTLKMIFGRLVVLTCAVVIGWPYGRALFNARSDVAFLAGLAVSGGLAALVVFVTWSTFKDVGALLRNSHRKD